MNKRFVPLLLLACLFLTACSKADGPKDKVEEIRMEVASETGITYAWWDDGRTHPIECMLVKTPDDPDWWPMMFEAIEGFTYERGHAYELGVRRTTLADPPADASGCTYSLIKIWSDRLVAAPEVPADANVSSINDIEYQALCPFDKYAIEPLYYINGAGEIIYSDGRRAPNYKDARLYIEQVLPKEDPNWITFQSVPYQATYAYVFSPLSDKIRLVRNESSGPMFRQVVPEAEFDYLVGHLEEDEELPYTLVLANVHKRGLQKLTFTLRKK